MSGRSDRTSHGHRSHHGPPSHRSRAPRAPSTSASTLTDTSTGPTLFSVNSGTLSRTSRRAPSERSAVTFVTEQSNYPYPPGIPPVPHRATFPRAQSSRSDWDAQSRASHQSTLSGGQMSMGGGSSSSGTDPAWDDFAELCNLASMEAEFACEEGQALRGLPTRAPTSSMPPDVQQSLREDRLTTLPARIREVEAMVAADPSLANRYCYQSLQQGLRELGLENQRHAHAGSWSSGSSALSAASQSEYPNSNSRRARPASDYASSLSGSTVVPYDRGLVPYDGNQARRPSTTSHADVARTPSDGQSLASTSAASSGHRSHGTPRLPSARDSRHSDHGSNTGRARSIHSSVSSWSGSTVIPHDRQLVPYNGDPAGRHSTRSHASAAFSGSDGMTLVNNPASSGGRRSHDASRPPSSAHRSSSHRRSSSHHRSSVHGQPGRRLSVIDETHGGVAHDRTMPLVPPTWGWPSNINPGSASRGARSRASSLGPDDSSSNY